MSFIYKLQFASSKHSFRWVKEALASCRNMGYAHVRSKK
nr:MAG TPA: hypothetical protein [Caudoviricetes sp.]